MNKQPAKTKLAHALVESDYKLNLRQKVFAQCYLKGGNGYRMGNATRSYAEAFEYDISEQPKADVCAQLGMMLLRNIELKRYMRDFLEADGWNDEAIDSRTSQIVYTGKDADALNAIKEYNKLQQRITEKVEVEGEISYRLAVPPKKKSENASTN